MLASEYHIKRQGEISRVTRMGHKVHRKWYTACIYYRGDSEVPRFAFVISNKISKLATSRNRIRRVLNDTVRYNLQNIPKGVDVVLLAKPELADQMSDAIGKDFGEFIVEMFAEDLKYQREN